MPFTHTLLAIFPLRSRRRRSAISFAAATLLLSASAASAQDSALPVPPATSTLDLTLNTGEAPRPPVPPKQAKSAASTPRRAGAAAGRVLPALSSRSSLTRESVRQQPGTAPTVLASLGLVTPREVRIHLSRDAKSRLLNVVSKGTYLAVVSEMGDHYGVLMVNNTLGWVPKNTLQMVDYQTEVSLPPDPQTPPSSTATNAAETSAGLMGQMASQMTPRSHAMLKEAFTYLGVPYVWAGNTRAGLDCSGFVKNVLASQGVRLPRHSGDQAKVGMTVQWNDLRAGDRLYFDMGRKGAVSHTGIYLGNGLFIHASTNRKCVYVDSLAKPNYSRALVVAKRDF